MGEAVSDIDLSTTILPQEVITRLQAAGHKGIPTGIDHGTITAVIDSKSFEVTTLRQDIKTDGRHAVVEFGKDWSEDAYRRDLTMNALYCDADGQVYDPVGGYDDLINREVRFIGDPVRRIEEDALRILRFFRFFAWYGNGRPDADGLKACAAHKALLDGLSVERIWMELKKLLSARDPGRALLWMRTAGVLAGVLPESEKWGIDAIPGLIRLEDAGDKDGDAMLRLMAILPPDSGKIVKLARRLAMSTAEKSRLADWADNTALRPDLEKPELEKLLYRGSRQGMIDSMWLAAVRLEETGEGDAMLKLLEHANSWKRPLMPVKGRDLTAADHGEGPALGKMLKNMEDAWVESGFKLSKKQLLDLEFRP